MKPVVIVAGTYILGKQYRDRLKLDQRTTVIATGIDHVRGLEGYELHLTTGWRAAPTDLLAYAERRCSEKIIDA